MAHKLTIETVDNVSRLICSKCRRPFMEIKDGELKVLSKHGPTQHENTLTISHLEMIAVELYRQLHPPQRW